MKLRAESLLLSMLLGGCTADPGGTELSQVETDGESGAQTGTPPIETICDGSDGVRLLVFAPETGSVPRPQAQMVMYENGLSYFYVTGTCEFVVSGNRASLQEDRRGQLIAGDAEQLFADLHVSLWNELAGNYVAEGVEGGDLLKFVGPDGETKVSCRAGCVGADTPTEVVEMFEAALDWHQRLRDNADGLPGAVRVAARANASAAFFGAQTRDWPLDWPLASIAFTTDDPGPAGTSRLVSPNEETDALRTLRSSYDAEYDLDQLASIGIWDDGVLYQLYMRDVIPVEDSTGLAPWSSHLP